MKTRKQINERVTWPVLERPPRRILSQTSLTRSICCMFWGKRLRQSCFHALFLLYKSNQKKYAATLKFILWHLSLTPWRLLTHFWRLLDRGAHMFRFWNFRKIWAEKWDKEDPDSLTTMPLVCELTWKELLKVFVSTSQDNLTFKRSQLGSVAYGLLIRWVLPQCHCSLLLWQYCTFQAFFLLC